MRWAVITWHVLRLLQALTSVCIIICTRSSVAVATVAWEAPERQRLCECCSIQGQPLLLRSTAALPGGNCAPAAAVLLPLLPEIATDASMDVTARGMPDAMVKLNLVDQFAWLVEIRNITWHKDGFERHVLCIELGGAGGLVERQVREGGVRDDAAHRWQAKIEPIRQPVGDHLRARWQAASLRCVPSCAASQIKVVQLLTHQRKCGQQEGDVPEAAAGCRHAPG